MWQTRATQGLLKALSRSLLLLCLVFPVTSFAQSRTSVLILHSYHKSDWTDALLRGMHSVLDSQSNVDFYVEYMDTKRICTPEYLELLQRGYALKYATTTFNVILTTDDNAFQFALQRQADLFHGAPLVFCGVNWFDDAMIETHPAVTGVLELGDFADTLALAFKVRPNARTVYVICDRSETGINNREELLRALKTRYPHVQVVLLDQLRIGELARKLHFLERDAFAFFVSFWQDGDRTPVSPETLEIVFRGSSVPVFGRSEWMVGRGLVGGKCVSGFHQGEAAARLAARILAGNQAADQPIIRNSPNKFMFDYVELKKHEIPLAALPLDHILMNAPTPRVWFGKYAALASLAGMLAMLLLIAFLVATIGRRMRMELALRTIEERYRALVDNLDFGINLINRNRTVLMTNTCQARKFGKIPDDLVGRKCYQQFEKLDHMCPDCPGVAAMRSGKSADVVRKNVQPDGTPRHIRIRAFPLRRRDGSLTGAFIEVTEDISDTMRAEAALRESEENLSITLNSIGDAVIATDATGRITRMNPVAERLTGWSFSDARGYLLADVFRIHHAETKSPLINPVERILTTGEIIGLSAHIVLAAKDGTERLITDSGAPIRNREGETIGVVLVFRDETDRRALEDRLRHVEKMEAIGQLAGGVAHDFNNLIGGIMGHAELLAMNLRGNDRLSRNALSIIDTAERAAELTRKLLAFSRKSTRKNVPVNLRFLLDEVSTLLAHTLDRRITISVKITAPRCTVMGDPAQLQSCLMNLAVNARDAMPSGGELGFTVTNVTLDEEFCRKQSPSMKPGEFVEVRVADTGTGMDKEVLTHLFEPFFTTKEVGKGTGLGLAMVYGATKDHKGTITVDSDPGHGSVFHLFFPLAPAERNAGMSTTSGTRIIQGKGQILLVDDEPAIRSTGQALLTSMGYEVMLAEDGEQGVALYKEKAAQIDLVILDMMMPKMSGRDAFRAMHALNPRVRALMISGFTLGTDAEELLGEGILALVQKPFKAVALSQTVAAVMSKSFSPDTLPVGSVPAAGGATEPPPKNSDSPA